MMKLRKTVLKSVCTFLSPVLSPVFSPVLFSGLAVAAIAALAACTVRTPTTETPIPTDRGIDKSFFVETQSTMKQGKAVTEIKPKTFLCGWAPISETGAISSRFLLHAVHMSNHCNMQFEVTEEALIGRLVNPTYPKEPARWKSRSQDSNSQALLLRARKGFLRSRNQRVHRE